MTIRPDFSFVSDGRRIAVVGQHAYLQAVDREMSERLEAAAIRASLPEDRPQRAFDGERGLDWFHVAVWKALFPKDSRYDEIASEVRARAAEGGAR